MYKEYTNQYVFNTYSNKVIINDSNNNWNNTHNFQVINENNFTHIINILKDNFYDKRNNVFYKYFDSNDIEYTVEIKNFKYFKEYNYSNNFCPIFMGDELDYILFNNGDLCSLNIKNFGFFKQLDFICNICSIINVNEIIQIEPYKVHPLVPIKCIVTGFFILDINHNLYKLENEEIFLVDTNINVFEIFVKIEFGDIKVSILFIKNNRKIVIIDYAITENYNQKLCTIENHRFQTTLKDDIIDINFIHDSIPLKLLPEITKTMFLDRDTKYITNNVSDSFTRSVLKYNNTSTSLIGDIVLKYNNTSTSLIGDIELKYNNTSTSLIGDMLINNNISMLCPNYIKNKYYDGTLTINILMIINKPIIFRFLMCLKKMKIYLPLLLIETTLSYLSINDFGKVVSFLED